MKDPTDPLWKDDPAIKEWEAFLDKYVPDADKANSLLLYALAASHVMEKFVKQASDKLTRENNMKQAKA